MALVTVQRSPSPSTDHDADSLSEDTTDGKSHLKKRLKNSKQKLRKVFSSVRFLSKLRPGLSESYFAYKGAALILPHTECTKKSSKKSHGGEIQDHLQAMLLLLRPEDQIKIAVRLEDLPHSAYKRYICVVSTRGRQDTEEAVILGMDCRHGEAVIGLMLPIWLGVKIHLEGDGSFRLCTDEQAYLFNPVSVQAMWSAIQSLVKVVHNAEEMKYIHDGLTHTWVEYYRSRIDHAHVSRNHQWKIEGVDVLLPTIFNLSDESDEAVKRNISNSMKVVMMSVDLEEVTCRALRQAVEEKLGFPIQNYKAYFDEEMIRIFGQMEGPSKILDYLYLGSEWNASNLDELKAIGIGYILNVTKEIDNFFAGTFQYYTIRVEDVPESDLLKHWDKTFKYISKARSHGSKVFVHCKMGISRSASTTMAYLMKENRWTVDEAFKFVKERRNVARPNEGFMEQLRMYEAILSASNKRYYFHSQNVDEQAGSPVDMEEGVPGEGAMMDQDYDCVLGDSMMASDWMALGPSSLAMEEDMEHSQYGSRLLPLAPDLEGTESRSGDSLEESLPDLLSPPATDRHKASPDGMPDPACCATSNTSPGLFKVKPDSFWIKQEEQEEESAISEEGFVEMSEEGGSAVISNQEQSTFVMPMTEDDQNVNLIEEACHEDKKLNPSSLSQMDIEDQSLSSSHLLSSDHNQQSDSTSFPTVPGAAESSISSFIPISTSQPTSDPDLSSNTTECPFVSKPNPTHVKAHEGDDISKDNNQQSVHIPSPSSNTFCSDTHISGAFTCSSMQSKDDGSDIKVTTNLPSSSHPGKVESGVRDYFFREKIPWNPGKVQKIREGIDRVGFKSDQAGEDNGGGDNREGLDVIVSDGDRGGGDKTELSSVEDDSRFKMDIDKEKIILDECMEASSPTKVCDPPVKTDNKEEVSTCEVPGAASLSLYEKEEIPLEPGTVLRTRMEIEERQKFSRSSSGEVDMQTSPSSPTKPVLRTSSLKATSTNQESTQHSPSNLPHRRVSCGPVMERIKHLRKIENHHDDLEAGSDDYVMMEEDDDIETGNTITVEAISENVECLLQKENTSTESKYSDLKLHGHAVDLGSNLTSELCTDLPENITTDSSGIVKSFVRKIEKHPTATDQKTTAANGDKTCTDSADIMSDNCGDIHFLPLAHSNLAENISNNDKKIDLGLVSGESNTDSHLYDEGCECDSNLPHDESKCEVSTTVRHLVGQFETKTPLDNIGTAKGGVETDHAWSDDYDKSVKLEPHILHSGDHEHGSVLMDNTDGAMPLSDIQVAQTADVISSTTLLTTDNAAHVCKEDRQKEIWTPYQPISSESTGEDITSLRQKFERNSSCEGAEGGQSNTKHSTKNRKASRPKSVERMCGIFEGKCKSDTNLSEEKKDCDADTTFRQVSEERRKVRRLHGKSHPLTKLSQGRGIFHSSM